MKKSKKGFTLTELLVVVLVIGVLAAIALPSYTKSVKKSRVSDALNNLNIVSLKQQDYMLNNETYATTFKDLNVPIAGLTTTEGNTATVGSFDYTLSDACISAVNNRSGENYTLVKNVETQATGCINGENSTICSMFSDLVSTDSVGCEYVAPGEDGGSGITPSPDKDCGSCTKTCWDGSTISGTCNSLTGVCDYSGVSCPPQYSCLASKPAGSESCGNCGVRTREVTCNTYTGEWQSGEWSICSNEGVCTPGNTDSSSCSDGKKGTMTRTCNNSCQWGSWDDSSCQIADKCEDPEYARQNACECNPSDSTCCAGNPKSKWDPVKGQCVCPSGKYETNGICCPTGQVSLDGKKCVYEYVPERVNVGILADCHNTYRFIDKNTCRRNGKKYFIGGKLPYVAKGGGCTEHHAYYNGGMWWEGGQYQGDYISTCNSSKTDAELCTQNCSASTCSFKCMRSENVPTTCGVYSCSNGRHCDNSSGSGVMLRCKRKN